MNAPHDLNKGDLVTITVRGCVEQGMVIGEHDAPGYYDVEVRDIPGGTVCWVLHGDCLSAAEAVSRTGSSDSSASATP